MTLGQTNRNQRMRLSRGVFLCLLMCLFAIAAKTALYHPHQKQNQALTAAKMWSGRNASATSVPSVKIATTVVVLVALPVFCVATPRTGFPEPEGVAEPDRVWFSPTLFERPPPFVS